MSFFSDNSQQYTDELKREMDEIQTRFFSFIEKLELKAKEFTQEAIPELKELNSIDTDETEQEYHRLQSAVLGQLDHIQKKANEVQEEKITNFTLSHKIPAQLELYYTFRSVCYAKIDELDMVLRDCRKQIEDTYSQDYEQKYKQILDEFEVIKDKFTCNQCGSPISIPKIFYITTYISCPACQTQNTLDPSTQARQLEILGRKLAEQRTKYLLDEYEGIPAKSNQLYLEKHELRLSLIHEKNKAIIDQKNEEILKLELEIDFLEQKKPELYQKYLRALFDEWNKINPDMTTEHEKFYNSLLTKTQNL